MKINQARMGKLATGMALTALASVVLGGCAHAPVVSKSEAQPATGSPSAGATVGATASPTGTQSTESASSGGGSGGNGSNGDGSNGDGSDHGVPACSAAHVVVELARFGAASGHEDYILLFTNNGSSTCSLTGYPGAGVTDQPGQVVVDAAWTQTGFIGGSYPAPAPVVLTPGAVASTVLEWVTLPPDGQTPVGANCAGMDGGKLLITPPNTAQSTAFPAPGGLCDAGFMVHPLVSGDSGRAAAAS